MVDKLKVLTKDGLEHYDENIKDYIADGYMINTTYADLLAKVQAGTLTPGQQYRITDYVTTTVQAHTQSAGHVFDIIVTADSATQLNENARAVLHDGDTYFASSDLAAWKLKYSINNDTAKYAWADSTNGKGVIWEMTDEFGNTCPYDFKNIQYEMFKITDTTSVVTDLIHTYSGCYEVNGSTLLPSAEYFTVDTSQSEWSYTFDFKLSTDYTQSIRAKTYCCNNYIASYSVSGKAFLNGIVFTNTVTTAQCSNNTFVGQNHNIIFRSNCYDNNFDMNCNNILFGMTCYGNSFGLGCKGNYLGNTCGDNVFGHGMKSCQFGRSCKKNKFGDECEDNILQKQCDSNYFGDKSSYNRLGTGCSYNKFGGGCEDITLGNYSSMNEFGSFGISISLGTSCRYNMFDKNATNIKLTDNCSGNTINTSHRTIPLATPTMRVTGDSANLTLTATGTLNNSGSDTITVSVRYCFIAASGKLYSGEQTVTAAADDTALTFTENITDAADASGAKFTSVFTYMLGDAGISFRADSQ